MILKENWAVQKHATSASGQAAEQNADWIFFLDADDIMAPSAFEYVSPYMETYDAIWGSIWTIEQGEQNANRTASSITFSL